MSGTAAGAPYLFEQTLRIAGEMSRQVASMTISPRHGRFALPGDPLLAALARINPTAGLYDDPLNRPVVGP
jgi:hypothetical protein